MSTNLNLIISIARRLMSCPTAPYHEAVARAEAERICAEHNLSCERDPFGNLFVRLLKVPKSRAMVLAAHLDHPGFDVVRQISARSFRARFQGGVPADYFRRGIRVRLQPGNHRATLGKRLGGEKEYELQAENAIDSGPTFAVWDLEDFAMRGARIHGRVCDDLIGVAAILATLIELKEAHANVNVIGLLSRAEEVGFHGALAATQAKELPKDALVISLETSRELPPVKMGAGVIIRVGDRASIFDSTATRYLVEVAGELQKAEPDFAFQRALMSGGTCEATAFQEYGYQTAAVCVALGNYHNCAPAKRIASEFVNVNDVAQMVRLLAAAARQMPHYAELVARLPKRLAQLAREARKSLREST